MTYQELSEAVKSWNAGDKVRFVFLPGTGPKQTISGEQGLALAHLAMGGGKREVALGFGNTLISHAVFQSRCWENDANRSFEVTVLSPLVKNPRTFIDRVHAALESTTIVSS